MHVRPAFAAALALTALALAPVAHAADQTILGKSYVLKDPKPGVDPSVRSCVVLGKELASSNTVVGNPISGGAQIDIAANGANSGVQQFFLPAGAATPPGPGWKALGTLGFSYKDSAGVNGPVKVAIIKRASNGTFLVKAVIKGALGPGPQPHITVLPPAPGNDGGMRFTIGAGDSYCVQFGGAAGGLVTNAPKVTFDKVFKVVKPTAENGCPTPTPTTTSSTTSTVTSTTTSTTSPGGALVLRGALTSTPGRFNYNLTLGLPGANSACNSNFAGTHACTYAELQSAQAHGDLVGLKDIANNTVNSFWAIDNAQPPLQQCQDDVMGGSGLNWEYATAHTMSRGQRVALTNGTGTLGPLQSNLQCNLSGSSWVGCCQ